MDELGTIPEILKGAIELRNSIPNKLKVDKTLSQKQAEIKDALDEFMECVRYLNTRRTKGTVLTLASEDDVQDALYLMLRPWIKDLAYEDPGSKSANRFVIKDFFVPSAGMIIEAKFIRDKRHGKDVSKELHDDIEMYKQIQGCSNIVFFIYDPNGHIPSVKNIKDTICITRTYNGVAIVVDVIVKP